MSKKIYKIGKVCDFKELTNFVGNKKFNTKHRLIKKY